jgi:hypothetical protein
VVLAIAAAVLLGGCGSASHAKAAANGCGSGKHGARLMLVLNDVSPIPHLAATTGAYVEVVSSYHGNQMAFPAAHPSTAVCVISRERSTGPGSRAELCTSPKARMPLRTTSSRCTALRDAARRTRINSNI